MTKGSGPCEFPVQRVSDISRERQNCYGRVGQLRFPPAITPCCDESRAKEQQAGRLGYRWDLAGLDVERDPVVEEVAIRVEADGDRPAVVDVGEKRRVLGRCERVGVGVELLA